MGTCTRIQKEWQEYNYKTLSNNITECYKGCSWFVPCISLRYYKIVAGLRRWKNKNSWSDVHGLFHWRPSDRYFISDTIRSRFVSGGRVCLLDPHPKKSTGCAIYYCVSKNFIKF